MTETVVAEPIPAAARVVGYRSDPVADGSEATAGTGERRTPWWFFWTWLVTPHIEFGAIYVGMIVVLNLYMSLEQALLGIFLGTAFGALSHGVLTARGVRLKVPQVLLGRLAFGTKGNLVLTTIMAIISAGGWFIVNSLVGALAINALFDGLPVLGALAIVVVVQLLLAQVRLKYRVSQRYLYPVFTAILVIAGIYAFATVDPSTDAGSPWDLNGIIAIIVVACIAWAYTIGWNPYATDYSDTAPSCSPTVAGVCSALGLFVSTMFLMAVGVAAAIIVAATGLAGETNPAVQFTSFLPGWLTVLVLLVLIIGAWNLNAIALKSARTVISVERLGIRPEIGRHLGPMLLTLAAFFLGWAATADLPANYQGFVMVLGVWIAPWLNVTLIDWLLRRRDKDPTPLLYQEVSTNKWGVISVVFALGASILIWGIQIVNGGRMGGPNVHGIDYAALAMLAGFYLSALIYSAGMKKVFKQKAAAQGR